jgi:hypothetical protein
MDKRLWNWIGCYHTQPETSVPFEMWLMLQRFYRLTEFLGQGSGSAQPISRWLLNGILYTDQSFSSNFNKMVISLIEMGLSWTSTPHLALGWYLLIRLGFITNLIIFISKHNHVLNMIRLFPSSTPIINPLYFLHQLPLPRVYSWLYLPSEMKNIISLLVLFTFELLPLHNSTSLGIGYFLRMVLI